MLVGSGLVKRLACSGVVWGPGLRIWSLGFRVQGSLALWFRGVAARILCSRPIVQVMLHASLQNSSSARCHAVCNALQLKAFARAFFSTKNLR